MNTSLPRVLTVRQNYPVQPQLDCAAVLAQQFAQLHLLDSVKPGARIAIAAGSRGIAQFSSIVSSIVKLLQAHGARPFIVPAMGSHGGATPEGQRAILSDYGISEERIGVPIEASLDVEQLGTTPDGVPVYFSSAAIRSDGIVVLNRVKPHTDFAGNLGSGILKMIAVGLAKRAGAAASHAAASRLGMERVIRSVASISLSKAPILCAVALVEDQRHQTVSLTVLKPGEIESREGDLFREALRLMPRLPLNPIDLLIVDRLGKNISGSGMDPNVIGRDVHGYSSSLASEAAHGWGGGPLIRRIFVRELTPQTHGNAVGIGMADLTTTRLVSAIDKKFTYINSLTALTPHLSKIPIHFDTDREVLSHALASLALTDNQNAKIVRIADTLSLDRLHVSQACGPLLEQRSDLDFSQDSAEMQFDSAGNLTPL